MPDISLCRLDIYLGKARIGVDDSQANSSSVVSSICVLKLLLAVVQDCEVITMDGNRQSLQLRDVDGCFCTGEFLPTLAIGFAKNY